MTEHEWLAAADGGKLVEYWGARFTERKARLLMLACCRRHEVCFANVAVFSAIAAIISHYADPLAPDAPFEGQRLRQLHQRVERHASDLPQSAARGVAFGVVAAIEPRSVALHRGRPTPHLVRACLNDIATSLERDGATGEREAQAALVRDILGNPFRAVQMNPEWRTDAVAALARHIHITGDFGAMPILADALQEAGCEDEDILNHCRHEPLHVRGCWVVDLILEK